MRLPFGSLQTAFTDLPYRKDYLSSGQVDSIIREACDEMCSHCYQREICWGSQSQEMYRGSERMIRSMEAGDPRTIQETKERLDERMQPLFTSIMRLLVTLNEGAAEADLGQPDDREPPCCGTAAPGDVQNHGHGGR